MTTGPDPAEPASGSAGDHSGRSLARWATALVAVILAVTAGAAFTASQGSVPQSDDVALVTETPTATATAAATELPSATPTTEGQTPADATPTAGATAAGAEATNEPTPVPTTAPTATPTQAPPRVRLNPEAVGLGETLSVHVYAPEAAGGSIVVNSNSYPLIVEDAGFLFAVVGIPLNAALGPHELDLSLRDGYGAVVEERTVPFEVVTVDRPVDQLTLTEEQGSVLTPEAAALESQLRTEQFLTFDTQPRWTGLFRFPVDGIPTTEFGQGRSINGGPVGGFHTGADLANEAGTPIQAAAPGRVSWVGEMPIRGNSVIIDHGAGVKTGYHHLQKILVEVGQEVVAGEVVGEMGSTGLSTGPHLHWELTIYGVNVDPKTWAAVDFTQ